MSHPNELAQQVQLFLPKYLSPAQKDQLWSELSSFPNTMPYYLHKEDLRQQLLQGDGWKGFVVLDFHTGNHKKVAGAILSNTCDISPDNQRDLSVNVLFSPLIELDKFVSLLRSKGKTDTSTNSLVSDIRRQRLTSVFYFPAQAGLKEHIILLDNIHIHPLEDFLGQDDREPIFKLSQSAFYLFLIKLSIHFTRFQEGVVRF